MYKSTNIPYRKEYDENGELSNPIEKSYISFGNNRKQRREKEARFKGNNKGISLSIIGSSKYERIVQLVPKKVTIDGKIYEQKTINHYAAR